jgi:phytoene synthase
MTTTLATGYESAREVTRHHAKSFYFSSIFLMGDQRRGAFALYAFCRRLDDAIDESTDDGARRALLGQARAMVDALFSRGELIDVPGFPRPELEALLDTCRRFGVPSTPFFDLIDGMEMDLTKARYASWNELHTYCYRVAGVIGLMMAPLLGTTDPRALRYAVDLGIGMQLTNILRDVREDLGRGRVYLPQDELAAHGVTEADLQRGQVTEGVARFLRVQLVRSRSLYSSAELGVPFLKGFMAQRLVRLMGSLYSGILDVIERRRLDVFSARASVSRLGKLWHLVKVLITPSPAPRPQPTLTEGTS